MQKFIPLTLVLAISTPAARAQGTQSADALELLTKAQNAASDLKGIAFDVSLVAEGAAAEAFTTYEGNVQAQFSERPDQWRIHISANRTVPKAQSSSDFKFLSDGRRAALIDERAQTFATGTSSEGRVTEREALLPPSYFGKDAFADEVRAARLQSVGEFEVGKVLCNVIEVAYDSASRRKARIFIGKDDHIIRRYERAIMFASGTPANSFNSKIITTFENVKLNPKLSESSFVVAQPEGYAVTAFPAAKASVRSANAAQVAPKGDSPGPSKPIVSPRTSPLKVGDEAPDWTLKNLEGKDISLKSLRGRVVVLDFWATWCGPCRMAMPTVQEISNKYAGKLVSVYGVNCLERSPTADPRAVIKQERCTYGQLLDGTPVARSYGVRGLPTFCVIGKDGKILYHSAGFNPDAIEQAIDNGLK